MLPISLKRARIEHPVDPLTHRQPPAGVLTRDAVLAAEFASEGLALAQFGEFGLPADFADPRRFGRRLGDVVVHRFLLSLVRVCLLLSKLWVIAGRRNAGLGRAIWRAGVGRAMGRGWVVLCGARRTSCGRRVWRRRQHRYLRASVMPGSAGGGGASSSCADQRDACPPRRRLTRCASWMTILGRLTKTLCGRSPACAERSRQGRIADDYCARDDCIQGVPQCRIASSLPKSIEPLVQFIEDTPPDQILDRTMEKLRAGVPTQMMLTASALAVARSSDLPPGHHGGPLHPLAGLIAVSNLVGRLEGEQRFVPVLQHVALSNKHIHHPAMGPYSLLEFEAMDFGGVQATKDAFLAAVKRGETNKADHCFLWLWKNIPPVEALDLLLTVAIPKNAMDDHYFIFPAFTFRALETHGAGLAAGADAAGRSLRYPLPHRPRAARDRYADGKVSAARQGHPAAQR